MLKKGLKQKKNDGEQSCHANISGHYKPQWSQQYCMDPEINREAKKKERKKQKCSSQTALIRLSLLKMD